MRNALLLLLFFAFVNLPGECTTTFFPPLYPADKVNNAAQNNTIGSAGLKDAFTKPVKNNYSAITGIEESLFGKTYTHQNISTRLSRIEKSLFTTTYPHSSYSQRIDNIISNFNQINKHPNISRNVLSRIESKVFNQKFTHNSPQRRIERLEERVFGAVQSGDINERYKALQIAAKNYNPRNNYLAPNTIVNNQRTGILSNIGNAIFGGGSVTGFTPSINPYANYGNNYYNSYANPYNRGSGIYRGTGINRGPNGYSYSDNLTNYGSSTGVTILD